MKNILSILGIIFIAKTVMGAASGYLGNSVVVQNFKVKKKSINFEGIKLELTFDLINKTFANVKLKDIKGNIKYGNYAVARIDYDDPKDLFPNKPLLMSFTVSINWANLAANVTDMINTQSFLSTLSFDGIVTTGIAQIPINTPIKLAS